jgi:membrane protein YdbS with pleckstrin-like domain
MISYSVYKIVHVAGILLLFLSLGAFLFSSKESIQLDKKTKRPWMIMHGVSLFFVLLGGFGLLARLGIVGGFPSWVWVKLVIWTALGGAVTLILKKPNLSKVWLVAVMTLGILAAYSANYKF